VLATDLGGSHPDILVFEGFRLDVPRAEFTRAGKSVPLRPKTFTLLRYLACNAGRVISKAELLAQVWPGVVVTDDSLSQCVGELRTALAERGPILIRTLPKRGYLFDASVTGDAGAIWPAPPAGDAGDPAPMQRHRAGLWAAAAGAFVLALATLIVGVKALDSTKPARIDAALAARRSIAVVPFTDKSSPKAPHFAEGVTQEIVNNLGRLPDVLVVAGAAAGSLPDAAAAGARSVGRDFDVRHVLTGSVQRDAERTAINVQMARTDTGALMWSERFEVDRGDADWVYDISQRVAASLEIKLAQAAVDPTRRDARSTEAMDLWMRGDYLLRHVKTHSELLEARRDFEAALLIDPQSLHALSTLSMTHVCEVLYRWTPDRKRSLALAKELAQRALSLDPDHPLALDALGNAHAFDSDFDAAHAVFQKALKVNPSSAKAQLNMASLLYFMARFEELKPYVANVMRLGRLDTTSVGKGHSILAYSLMAQGQDEEAYRELRQAVIAAPSLPGARYGLIAAAALTGRIDEAHRLVAELLRDRPETTIALIRAARSSANPEFRKAHLHYFDGLRLSGLPEGDAAAPKLAATALDVNRK